MHAQKVDTTAEASATRLEYKAALTSLFVALLVVDIFVDAAVVVVLVVVMLEVVLGLFATLATLAVVGIVVLWTDLLTAAPAVTVTVRGNLSKQ